MNGEKTTGGTVVGSVQRPMSAGEIAVGLTFNPSQNQNVDLVKRSMAQIFDIVEQSVSADDGTIETARKRKMRDHALAEIITAQMWAVKILTLK